MPWSRDAFARKQFWTAAPRDGLSRLAALVPPGASVSAANHLGAHFALRETLRLFPDGWETADVVLVDVGGRDYVGAAPNSDAFRPLLRALVETRTLLAADDGLAAFGRGAPSPDAVARLIGLRAGPAPGPGAEGSPSLAAARVEQDVLAPRETLRVRYAWMAGTEGTGIPCVTETLAPAAGAPVVRRTRPMFHGLLAGRRWPAGTLGDEAIGVVVPDTALPGLYTWSVTAWRDRDGRRATGRPRMRRRWQWRRCASGRGEIGRPATFWCKPHRGTPRRRADAFQEVRRLHPPCVAVSGRRRPSRTNRAFWKG
jgi:hypothetical protein